MEQAVALAQAGINIGPAAVFVAPAPGYDITLAPTQAPLPEAAPRRVDTLMISTPSIAPAPDAMGPAPSSDTDTLARDVVDLPLYPLDGYGL